MNIISFQCIWILVLIGGYFISATDNENSHAPSKLDICGSYTYHSIKPILNYVYQLQSKQLSNKCAVNLEEQNNMHEKILLLQRKQDEGRIKDELILSKDLHIKDLQARNSELQKINNIFEKMIESVNNEIVQLKTFIKDELGREFNKIHVHASKLRYYEEQLIKKSRAFAESAAQLKYRDGIIRNCRLRLNEAQNSVREFKDRVQIVVVENASRNASTRNFETKHIKLDESQTKNKQTINANEEEESKLEGHIKNDEGKPNSCIPFVDSNGIHNIKLPNLETFPVLCDSNTVGSGWTIIQQRINGAENFTRNWETYKHGFGTFEGDFFLGLEWIHRLSVDQPQELYIHMEWFNGSTFFARYDNFSIAGEDDKYKLLSLGTFSGSARIDKMSNLINQKFSTFDSDNDDWENVNCANDYKGGWWYESCGYCNLNGKYFKHQVNEHNSNWWFNYISLKTIKMLIHPRGD